MSMLKFKDPQTGLWVSIPAAGGGLPSGGSTGQFLSKTANGIAWVDLLPGGSTDQFLKKTSGGIEWSDLPEYKSMKLLWTNASPSSSFSSQTIALDLSGYNAVLILFRFDTGSTSAHSSIGIKGLLMSLEAFYNYRALRGYSVSDSGVWFNSASGASQTGNLAENNSQIIPYSIYGIKGVQ